ncbi:MAG: universal stress protein [Betaproteobacteria bacterium]|nr:universal stress protein [Betaproteobacteria bacterium]
MFNDILLAVDLGEPGSWKRALPAALELCKASSAVLHVISVLPAIDPRVSPYLPADASRKMIEEAAGDLRDFVKQHVPAGIKVQDIVAQGAIYKEILAAAEKIGADLVVMASHKPGARDYLLGANAAHVVRHCPRSVMVVRG